MGSKANTTERMNGVNRDIHFFMDIYTDVYISTSIYLCPDKELAAGFSGRAPDFPRAAMAEG